MRASPPVDTVTEHYNPIVVALTTMPKPVVAAVNGVAAGAGASLAFASDLRILADTAGYNTSFAGVALSCDTGSSWTLPRLVGRAKAMELLYFPAHCVGAGGARAGARHAGRLAGRLRRCRRRAGPPARGRAHRVLRLHPGRRWRTPPRTRFEESLAFEAEKMALTGGTEDHLAAVNAFVAKEKPVYRGR